MLARTINWHYNNFALEQGVGVEVMVEYDKLIDRQLERAAITSISGFAKLFADASKVLKLSGGEASSQG